MLVTLHIVFLFQAALKSFCHNVSELQKKNLWRASRICNCPWFFLAINCPWIWFHLFLKKNDSTSCGTKRRQGWKGREWQPLLCTACFFWKLLCTANTNFICMKHTVFLQTWTVFYPLLSYTLTSTCTKKKTAGCCSFLQTDTHYPKMYLAS